MSDPTSETIHATAIAIDGAAVLITGRSGSGKSDLALRLIDRGAALVSDDYTLLRSSGGALFAAAPDRIAGLMEIRGIGIVEMAAVRDMPVALIVDLDRAPDRMPDPGEAIMLAGIAVPVIALEPFHGSAPIKVEYALRQARKGFGEEPGANDRQ